MSIAASNSARAVGKISGPGAAPHRVPAASAQTAAKPVFAHVFAAQTEEEELRLELSDLPRLSTGLQVEGLRRTLMSRIFGLFIR